MTTLEFLACLLLIGVSAFMSSSEIALFSLSRFQLRSLKERVRPAHRKIKRLLADPSGLLVTTLLVNEVVNIALSALIMRVVSRSWETDPRTHEWVSRVPLLRQVPDWALLTVLGILITTPLILFLGEITPKVIAAKANHLVAPLNVGPLGWLYDWLKPFRLAVSRLLAVVTPREIAASASEGQQKDEPVLREEEFLFMVEEGHKEGAIHESELELIRNVFDLDDRTVVDIYTPLQQVYALPANTTIKDAFTSMHGNAYSRIPITGANRKHVIGMLYSKDLLLADAEKVDTKSTVTSLMRKPLVVGPHLRLNALFRKLKQYKTHMAIVERAAGDCIGIVTMTDVLEALFEDLLHDADDEVRLPTKEAPK